MAQPAHIVPLITGFNTNVRIYQSYTPLSTLEMAFGTDELFDWDRQQQILDQCLQRCKHVLDSIPDVLKVHPQDSQNGRFGQRKQPYYPPMPEYLAVRDPALDAFQSGPDPAEARRTAQYEIQKANIYATHLSIRSFLVEKYFTLLGKHNAAEAQKALEQQHQDSGGGLKQDGGGGGAAPDATLALAASMDRLIASSHSGEHEHEQGEHGVAVGVGVQGRSDLEDAMAAEKEQVVRELLVVLGSIDMVNMEPNGDSFVSSFGFTPFSRTRPLFFRFVPANALRPKTQKIRQIASTLLDDDSSGGGSGGKGHRASHTSITAQQNQEYLRKFLDILSRLERIPPAPAPASGGQPTNPQNATDTLANSGAVGEANMHMGINLGANMGPSMGMGMGMNMNMGPNFHPNMNGNGNGNGAAGTTATGDNNMGEDGGGGGSISGNIAGSMGGMEDEDENELRVWADLRELQVRFQEQGGIWGFS
jgi:hypothetical protein